MVVDNAVGLGLQNLRKDVCPRIQLGLWSGFGAGDVALEDISPKKEVESGQGEPHGECREIMPWGHYSEG